jgi:hypothetical protein
MIMAQVLRRTMLRPAGLGACVMVVVSAGIAFAADAGGDGDPAPVATAADTTSAAPRASAPEPAAPLRIAPPREELPALAPVEELERRATAIPPEQRMLYQGEGRWIMLQPAVASPVFTLDDNTFVGMHVDGVGLVDPGTYGDPGVDLERLARERMGADRYHAAVEQARSLEQCLEGEAGSSAPLDACI